MGQHLGHFRRFAGRAFGAAIEKKTAGAGMITEHDARNTKHAATRLSKRQRDYMLRFAEVYRIRRQPAAHRQTIARAKIAREEG